MNIEELKANFEKGLIKTEVLPVRQEGRTLNIADFKIGDRFITNALPVDRAVKCGIEVVAIQNAGINPKQEPAKVEFKRLNPDNPEVFNLRANENGEVGMGNWIKYSF